MVASPPTAAAMLSHDLAQGRCPELTLVVPTLFDGVILLLTPFHFC
jgi:hypothetical protein